MIEGFIMLELLTSWTSLPNLHPLLVHFPIALLPTALVLELVGLLRARPWWPSRAAATLLILGAVLTFMAYEAGEEAAETLTGIPTEAQAVLAEHDMAAAWALRITVLALLLRLAVALHGRSRVAWYRAERGLSALVTALAVVAVAWTADLGGRLVYRHGLAVEAAPVEADAQTLENMRSPALVPAAPPEPGETEKLEDAPQPPALIPDSGDGNGQTSSPPATDPAGAED
jgi:uncharacterized membrane protein